MTAQRATDAIATMTVQKSLCLIFSLTLITYLLAPYRFQTVTIRIMILIEKDRKRWRIAFKMLLIIAYFSFQAYFCSVFCEIADFCVKNEKSPVLVVALNYENWAYSKK